MSRFFHRCVALGLSGMIGEACSTAAPVVDGGVDAANASACVASDPAGGAVVSGTLCYPSSSKPAGTCSTAMTCSFCQVTPCDNGGYGPRTEYSCGCGTGTWQCAELWRDTVICPPRISDAAGVEGDGTLE